jgi:anti-sigma regulatory factor (Ser/Thr protein kinase)
MTSEPPEQLVLPADLGRLAEARLWVTAHAERCGFGGRDLTEIELALTEALSNTVRHGLQQDVDQEVILEAVPTAGGLQIVLRDRGPAFDPTTRPEPDLSEPRAGGYGIHLIRTVMDEVLWQYDDGENRLTLVRRHHGEPDH